MGASYLQFMQRLRGRQSAGARVPARRAVGARVVRLRAGVDSVTGAAETTLCAVRDALERATRDVDLVSLARPCGDEFGLTLCVAINADPQAMRSRIERTVNCALAEAGLQVTTSDIDQVVLRF